jgi:hypothetical protein
MTCCEALEPSGDGRRAKKLVHRIGSPMLLSIVTRGYVDSVTVAVTVLARPISREPPVDDASE